MPKLRVSGSGFYRWLGYPDSMWKAKRQVVRAHVLDTDPTFRARYVAARIALELKEQGVKCSKNYVANILQREVTGPNGKAFKYSRHSPAMMKDNWLY